MIYCFKKMRELRLTHIFILNYAIALLIGGAAIAGFFWVGGGLQFSSIVVLYIVYTQPTIYMLRRLQWYKVKSEIKYGNYTLGEKMGLRLDAWLVKPTMDLDFWFNTASLIVVAKMFTQAYDVMLRCSFPLMGLINAIMVGVGFALWLMIINELKKDNEKYD